MHFGAARTLAAGFVLLAAGLSAHGAEAYVTRTNFVDKTVTNVIEVTVPNNRFVIAYHTNHVEHVRTNVVDLYTTNLVRRTATNHLVVDTWRTNLVNAYQTNVKQLTLTNLQTVTVTKTNWQKSFATNVVTVDAWHTNFVPAYHTNLKNLTLTNVVTVDAWRTNFVEAYTTNRKTLNLTNWETVIVMKTNWVKQPVTNVVEIDVAAKGAAATPQASSDSGVRLSTQPTPGAKDGFVLEAAKTSRAAADGRVEVELRVKSGSEAPTSFQVLKWKVERDDGSFLSFGQDAEFKKELPVGKYKVEARVQRQAGSAVQVIRGTMDVTSSDVVIQPTLLGRN